MSRIKINSRTIGPGYPPLVIAEVGINHEGNIDKAIQMIDDATSVGCECIKFQSHVIDDEMIPNDVVPGNAGESIWDIMSRCAMSETEEKQIKDYVESKGVIFLSTPFSRKASERLESLNVTAFKIGSGECNNYPLIDHIGGYGKPVILSTGMNDILSIQRSVDILKTRGVSFALMHCTSIYPTPYNKIRLGAIHQMKQAFPNIPIGLSDHSLSNYPCLAAVALGASLLERHFTSDKTWPGPDIEISMDKHDLKDLIEGSYAIFESMGGEKNILPEEQPTIDFAYASIVSISEIKQGELLSKNNIWVKRPGKDGIRAEHYDSVIGRKAALDIPKDKQIQWSMLK